MHKTATFLCQKTGVHDIINSLHSIYLWFKKVKHSTIPVSVIHWTEILDLLSHFDMSISTKPVWIFFRYGSLLKQWKYSEFRPWVYLPVNYSHWNVSHLKIAFGKMNIFSVLLQDIYLFGSDNMLTHDMYLIEILHIIGISKKKKEHYPCFCAKSANNKLFCNFLCWQ